MESNEWVNNLKAGDIIFVEEVRCFGVKFITIEDIPHTKNKYNRQTLEETARKFGRMYSGDSHCRLVEYSEKNLAVYDTQRKRDYCNKVIQKLYATKLEKLDAATLGNYYSALIQIVGV